MKTTTLRCLGVLAFCFFAGCGQTGVREAKRIPQTDLPRPGRILVYDFAVSEQEVKGYQEIMRQQPAIKDVAERERLVAQEVKDALAEELVDALKPLGFIVERVPRGTRVSDHDLLIVGQFMTVEEGNPSKPFTVGFGSGASGVGTEVQVYQAPQSRRVLQLMTQSDSGKLPGAAPLLGAEAVAQGGVSAGMAVPKATVSGVKTYQSVIARMAAASGNQVARYLSEFFAKQGWIRSDQVRKATVIAE